MIFRCSGLELDTESFSISRDGESVPVTPKVFDLLVYLIRNRGRLITRDQLIDEVWNGRLISDGALSNEIKLARAVLGDDGEQQKCIKTVRGRGYQFIGEVIESDDTAHPSVSQTTTQERARPNSIAVLPFDNRSDEEQDAYFTDGFHDELITHISRINELSTISRTSVMAYRSSQKSMRTIGSELNARNIIEGGVQRAGDQIRITVQLIDAENDEHIWADTYTRELSAQNIFAIQSEIALSVADKLRTVLSPQDKQQLTETPTQNMAALDAFFRGRVSYGLANSEGFSVAIEHFQKAIELDPDFAEAHAQLAMSLLEKVHFGGLEVEAQNMLAEPIIERALKLKPNLSEAYEALAFLQRHRGNYAGSKEAYEEAIRLNPNNTNALRNYGYFISWDCGESEESLQYFNRARLLDPQNHHTLTLMGQALMDLERFDESRAVLTSAIEAAPRFVPPFQMLGQLYAWKLYRHDEAIKSYQRAFQLDPNIPWTTFFLASAYEELGVMNRAIYFYEWHLTLVPDKAYSGFIRLKLHSLRGDHDKAKRLLEEISQGHVVIDPWHDLLFLGGFDERYAYPALAVDVFEKMYPALTEPDLDITNDNGLFPLALAYTTVLHLSGQADKATALCDDVIRLLPTKSRYRFRGIDLMDAWLHAAMGNEGLALKALREWRDLGGCRDLNTSWIKTHPLSQHPDYHAINDEILADLAQQREHLEQMESSGELAALTDLPPIHGG